MSAKNRSRWLRRVVVAMLLGSAVAGVVVVIARRDESKPAVAAASVLKPAAVTSGVLTRTEKIDGTLLLSDSLVVRHRIEGQTASVSTPGGATASGAGTSSTGGQSSRVTQTVTSVSGVGASAGLGDVLYTVNSDPVVALLGPLPAWRTLSTSSTPGPDVVELELALEALGYDPDHEVTVDQTFDSHTASMVKRWQTGVGLEATGTVTLGSVVFIPIPMTVSAVSTTVGLAVGEGDTILTLSGTAQEVVIDVPAGDEAFLVPGLKVQLGGDATGTVTLLRSTERSGAVVVQAVIAPDAPVAGVDSGGAISVTVSANVAANVLIVPSQALLSKLDGSYAVQVQAADGAVTWHTVEIVSIAGSKVAIRGEGISAGTQVLVPA